MATQQASLDAQKKNKLLRELLPKIADRGIAKKWAVADMPYTALVDECRSLQVNQTFLNALRIYLEENMIIVQTVETLLAQLAMAANSNWQDTPAAVQSLSRRGWFVGRWLPTFLIVDGPLGRVFKANDSPLSILLKKEHSNYPVLCAARDAFNHDLFRIVRNGIGHWAFVWKEESSMPQLEMVDERTGNITATISLVEAEAMHLVAFSVIEALDTQVFRFTQSSTSTNNAPHLPPD